VHGCCIRCVLCQLCPTRTCPTPTLPPRHRLRYPHHHRLLLHVASRPAVVGPSTWLPTSFAPPRPLMLHVASDDFFPWRAGNHLVLIDLPMHEKKCFCSPLSYSIREDRNHPGRCAVVLPCKRSPSPSGTLPRHAPMWPRPPHSPSNALEKKAAARHQTTPRDHHPPAPSPPPCKEHKREERKGGKCHTTTTPHIDRLQHLVAAAATSIASKVVGTRV